MANRLHIKKDDTVVVVSGKDKGRQGKVLSSIPKQGKVVVENVNVVARHTRPRGQNDQGGIIRSEAAIYASKVMLVCGKCSKATRIAYKIEPNGDKVRVCKKCGANIE